MGHSVTQFLKVSLQTNLNFQLLICFLFVNFFVFFGFALNAGCYISRSIGFNIRLFTIMAHWTRLPGGDSERGAKTANEMRAHKFSTVNFRSSADKLPIKWAIAYNRSDIIDQQTTEQFEIDTGVFALYDAIIAGFNHSPLLPVWHRTKL